MRMDWACMAVFLVFYALLRRTCARNGLWRHRFGCLRMVAQVADHVEHEGKGRRAQSARTGCLDAKQTMLERLIDQYVSIGASLRGVFRLYCATRFIHGLAVSGGNNLIQTTEETDVAWNTRARICTAPRTPSSERQMPLQRSYSAANIYPFHPATWSTLSAGLGNC